MEKGERSESYRDVSFFLIYCSCKKMYHYLEILIQEVGQDKIVTWT